MVIVKDYNKHGPTNIITIPILIRRQVKLRSSFGGSPLFFDRAIPFFSSVSAISSFGGNFVLGLIQIQSLICLSPIPRLRVQSMQSSSHNSLEDPLFFRTDSARFLFLTEKNKERRIDAHSQSHWKLKRKGSDVEFQTFGPKQMIKVSLPPEEESERMEVVFNYTYPMDHNDGLSILSVQAKIPHIKILFNRPEPSSAVLFEEEGELHAQIVLCQEIPNEGYFKVISIGLEGQTRIPIRDETMVKIKNIGFMISSSGRVVYRMFILLYRENEQREKTFKDMYMSKPIFIAEENRIIFVDDKLSLSQFVSEFGIQFMAATRRAKLASSLAEDMFNFQTHLAKRCKKILNVTYLAFKYHKICEIYFRSHTKSTFVFQEESGTHEENSTTSHCPYFAELADILIGIKKQIFHSPQVNSDSKLQCNKLNPEAKLVVRMTQTLEKTKFVISQQYTKYISIVTGEHEQLKEYQKLERQHIKAFYKYYLETLKNLRNIEKSKDKKKSKRGRKPKFYVEKQQSEGEKDKKEQQESEDERDSKDEQYKFHGKEDHNQEQSQKSFEKPLENHKSLLKNYIDEDQSQELRRKKSKGRHPRHYECGKKQRLRQKIAEKEAMNSPIVLKVSQLPEQKLKLQTPEGKHAHISVLKETEKQMKFVTPQTHIPSNQQHSQGRNQQFQPRYRPYPMEKPDFGKYVPKESLSAGNNITEQKDSQGERKYRFPPYLLDEYRRPAPFPYDYYPRAFHPERVSVPFCENCERMYYSSYGKKHHPDMSSFNRPLPIYQRQMYPERGYYPQYPYPHSHHYPHEPYRLPPYRPSQVSMDYPPLKQDWQGQKRYYSEIPEEGIRNYSKDDAERYYYNKQKEAQRHRPQQSENIRQMQDPYYRYESSYSQERRQS